ncbi:hypothetical protein BY458DRAFT_466964 [Sporodiniella umbellata]|nr:hypothetical protein BY458DRAFT_466964 [Sporodiniella umbellata]
MFQYHLKCILYTPDTIQLHTTLFDNLPDINTSSTEYLKDYCHPKTSQQSSIPRKPLSNNYHYTPPTPICSTKPQFSKHCLNDKIDFRFGPITLQVIQEKKPEKTIFLGHGVLHLYRDLLPMQDHDLPDTEIAKQESSQQDDGCGRVICILAVPTYITNKDFMQFLGSTSKDVLQYRFIRDFSPNKYTVLLKFKDRRSAFACFEKYNGRRFNMMEPEISHAVYLQSNTLEAYTIPQLSFPYMDCTLFQDLNRAEKTLEELPTCPVCLERMDESTTGLLGIQCRHTVQCDCINKWGQGSCLVCNYSQRPVLTSTKQRQQQSKKEDLKQLHTCSECYECQSTESLWICMICGHIGCGRYQDAHAYDHYVATGHLYTLEIETQRVWDYLGDGYVHRLIQNMVDGAIVELPPNEIGHSNSHQQEAPFSKPVTTNRKNTQLDTQTTSSSSNLIEKLENISIDYTYMLTSQLDSQRIYYEDQLDALSKQILDIESDMETVDRRLECAKEVQRTLKKKESDILSMLVDVSKEKDKLDKKTQSVKDKHIKTEKNLNEEKALTKSLIKNNAMLKKKVEHKEKTIEKLNLQVKDLMKVLEG